mgnify:CR=1 FL=1
MIIKIVKFTLRILSQVLIKFKLFNLAKIFSSIRASILLKKYVNVYFDGEDWIYKWNKSAAVSSVNYYDPNFNYIDLFGFLAALLTTIAFLPQLFKTWQTKSADDVSLVMLILFITGLFCWIIYGLKINSIPILVANIITFIFNFSILVLKISFRKNK